MYCIQSPLISHQEDSALLRPISVDRSVNKPKYAHLSCGLRNGCLHVVFGSINGIDFFGRSFSYHRQGWVVQHDPKSCHLLNFQQQGMRFPSFRNLLKQIHQSIWPQYNRLSDQYLIILILPPFTFWDLLPMVLINPHTMDHVQVPLRSLGNGFLLQNIKWIKCCPCPTTKEGSPHNQGRQCLWLMGIYTLHVYSHSQEVKDVWRNGWCSWTDTSHPASQYSLYLVKNQPIPNGWWSLPWKKLKNTWIVILEFMKPPPKKSAQKTKEKQQE